MHHRILYSHDISRVYSNDKGGEDGGTYRWQQHIRKPITYYNTHQCYLEFEGVWYHGENQTALVFENYFSTRLKWYPETQFVCFIFINKNITANPFTISTTDSPSSTRLQPVWGFLHVKQCPIVNTATSSESEDFSIHLHIDCVYSSMYSLTSTDTSKPALLALYRNNAPVDSPTKGQVTRKIFPRHNVIIVTLCNHGISLTTNTTHGWSLPSQPSVMLKICIYGWWYRYMYFKCCRKAIKLCKCDVQRSTTLLLIPQYHSIIATKNLSMWRLWLWYQLYTQWYLLQLNICGCKQVQYDKICHISSTLINDGTNSFWSENQFTIDFCEFFICLHSWIIRWVRRCRAIGLSFLYLFYWASNKSFTHRGLTKCPKLITRCIKTNVKGMRLGYIHIFSCILVHKILLRHPWCTDDIRSFAS